MAKRKTLWILASLGAILMAAGIFILASHGLTENGSGEIKNQLIVVVEKKLGGYESNNLDTPTTALLEAVLAEFSGDPSFEIYRFILANEIYRKADREFWELVKSGGRPTKSKIPDLEGNLALYEKYIAELDRLTIKTEGKESFLWQVLNNKGNTKVYEIFLGFMLKEDSKKLMKLAKAALADYVKAYEHCGQDKDCVNFVGQNIDFLTRIPPPPKIKTPSKEGDQQSSGGGGLGNLFQKDGSESGSVVSGQNEDNGRPEILIPGTSSGRSIRGAH